MLGNKFVGAALVCVIVIPALILFSLVGRDQRSSTEKALEAAAETGDTNTIANYLRFGWNIEAPVHRKHNFHDWGTLVDIAAESGQDKTVLFLLRYGANVNAKNRRGGTPLFSVINSDAPMETQIRIVEGLIGGGANVNLPLPNGTMPMDTADHFHMTQIVGILQKHGGEFSAAYRVWKNEQSTTNAAVTNK